MNYLNGLVILQQLHERRTLRLNRTINIGTEDLGSG